jgi:hypothetical protein
MKNLFIIKAITDKGTVYGIQPEKIHRHYLRDIFRALTFGPLLRTGRVNASFVPNRETLFVGMQLHYGRHPLANDSVNEAAGFLVSKNGTFEVHYDFMIYQDDWEKWKKADEVQHLRRRSNDHSH